MNIPLDEKLTDLRSQITERMQLVLTRRQPLSLYEPMHYAAAVGGKLLRPVLLLLACEATGGRSEEALDAAVALELVHDFTLVHDDIMDHDDFRRGRQTVHKHWDENVAILAGDGLLVTAYLTLGQLNSPRMQQVWQCFSQGIMEICEGQALDKEFEERSSVSLAEYFGMIEKKTARLFSVACEIGALLGQANDTQVKAMRQYGIMLGRAFQIQDDLLDITAELKVLGKDIGSDLAAHKKTFLTVYTGQHAGKRNLHRLSQIANKRPIDTAELREVIQIFQDCGTFAAARQEVLDALQHAGDALDVLPKSAVKAYLNELLKMVEERNS